MRLPLLLLASIFLTGCNRPLGQAEPFPQGFVWGGGNADYHGVRLSTDHVGALSAVGLTHFRMSLPWHELTSGDAEGADRAMADVRRTVALLDSAGIAPVVVLYQGGSGLARSPADRPAEFGQYAAQMFAALPEVRQWVTVADPFMDRAAAHPLPVERDTARADISRAPPFVQARRAARDMNPEQSSRPLLRTRLEETSRLLEAHAAALAVFRENKSPGEIGIILDLSPVYGASEDPRDARAAAFEDALRNRWMLDPLFLGSYPAVVMDSLNLRPAPPRGARPDFLGIDYFSPVFVEADSLSQHFATRLIPNLDGDKSEFGQADARSLHALVTRVAADYGNPPGYITGNGASYGSLDELNESGRIRDELRVRFLRRHLVQAQRAAADGADLRGFFVWTAFDGSQGTTGIIAAGPPGMVFKDSARYLRSIASENAVSRMPF